MYLLIYSLREAILQKGNFVTISRVLDAWLFFFTPACLTSETQPPPSKFKKKKPQKSKNISIQN